MYTENQSLWSFVVDHADIIKRSVCIEVLKSTGCLAGGERRLLVVTGCCSRIVVVVTSKCRFGRFPHRNKVLGRQHTAPEEAYLATADRYGQ